MTRRITAAFMALVLLAGCGTQSGKSAAIEGKTPAPAAGSAQLSEPETPAKATVEAEEENGVNGEEVTIKLKINDIDVDVLWEDNESVEALFRLAAAEPMFVEMSMYGGFEQVGALGTSLPRDDVQTATAAGDIVLYAGNQIVVFYGSNSWAYTRLGKIQGLSPSQFTELLGNGNVTLTISVE